MSDDLFKAERRKYKKGAFSVMCSGQNNIVKRLQKLGDGGKVAISRTVSDFRTRGPAWVSKGIREHYGVDNVAIKDAAKKPSRGRTSIKISGIFVEGATLEYKGRTLTPLHFKMTPKNRPDTLQKNYSRIPGQVINGPNMGAKSLSAMVRPPKPYKVKATIIKGQRVSLPFGTFVAKGNGNVGLPFQRTKEGRMPIEAVRTLSVPQMIDGRAHDTIEQKISTELGKRFEHNIKQAIK